jgi:hypothetical protein
MDFTNIKDLFPDYTEFELLTALQTIINESITITNKYGIPSYLREEKNSFFLVNSLSVKSDFYTEYYTKFPHIKSSNTYQQIIDQTYSESLPDLISKICKSTSLQEFTNIIKSIPVNIQETFIEAAMSAKHQNLNSTLTDIVLEFFKSYIKNVDSLSFSTFLDKKNQGPIRCFRKGKWKDCDEKQQLILQQQQVQYQQVLRENNPYGVMGKFNPENGKFCIVDFRKEQEAKESKASKSRKSDKRLTVSGQVCSTWKVEPLIRLGSQILNIEPPKEYRSSNTNKQMLERINKPDRYNLSTIFTQEEIKNATTEDLRRMLYWGTPANEQDGGIRGGIPMCKLLQSWFENNNLLEVDNLCGVRGKKVETIKTESKTMDQKFRIETYIPNEQEQQFGAYIGDIRKLMKESYNIEKYTPNIDNHLWIIIFSRKMVGFFSLDENNIISNLCIAKNYRRNNIAANAIKKATDYLSTIRKQTPTLIVDNFSKDYKKLIRIYESFGFEIEQKNDNQTRMIHKFNQS